MRFDVEYKLEEPVHPGNAKQLTVRVKCGDMKITRVDLVHNTTDIVWARNKAISDCINKLLGAHHEF